MINIRTGSHAGFNICVTEDGGFFTPRVMPEGAGGHGRRSEIWAGPPCPSFEHAMTAARAAIDAQRMS